MSNSINDDKTWDPLKTRGLHLCHLNVNSLSSKIDEIRDIANRIKPALLGITESKLDSSVTNMEVSINGYSIIRNGRNRDGGGVACYVKNDCASILKTFSTIQMNMYFSKFSSQKLNPLPLEYSIDLQIPIFLETSTLISFKMENFF